MATEEEKEAALEKAIGELVVEEGSALTRWVLAIETMDLATGVRSVEVDNAEGMYPWDVTGMLTHAVGVVEDEEEEA